MNNFIIRAQCGRGVGFSGGGECRRNKELVFRMSHKLPNLEASQYSAPGAHYIIFTITSLSLEGTSTSGASLSLSHTLSIRCWQPGSQN